MTQRRAFRARGQRSHSVAPRSVKFPRFPAAVVQCLPALAPWRLTVKKLASSRHRTAGVGVVDWRVQPPAQVLPSRKVINYECCRWRHKRHELQRSNGSARTVPSFVPSRAHRGRTAPVRAGPQRLAPPTTTIEEFSAQPPTLEARGCRSIARSAAATASWTS